MTANEALVDLLQLLRVERVVVIDDDFLAGPAEYLEAVEAGDAPEIKSLGELDDLEDVTAEVVARWSEVASVEKVRVRKSSLKAKRAYADPTNLRDLLSGQEFTGLSMHEWDQLKDGLLGSAKRTLVLFDVDLGSETGRENDLTGAELAAEALRRASPQIVGLLTSKPAIGDEEESASSWAAGNGINAADFVVVNKRLLRQGEEGDVERATEQIRQTLQAAQLGRLRTKIKSALERGLSDAEQLLGSRSPSALEDLVFRGSHDGGEWEGDTWFRLFNTLGLEGARQAVAVDGEVRSAVSDVRRLLQTRPQTSHPDSVSFAREVEAAEAYSPAGYVNAAGLPIANGDLFKATEGPMYVLVGQPCDLALRPDGRAYEPTTGTLLPVKPASGTPEGEAPASEEPKTAYRLPPGGPFGDGDWEVRFRPEYHAAFDVLDLCSLNSGGVLTTHPPRGTALEPLLPGVQARLDDVLKKQRKLQELLAQIDELQSAKHVGAQVAKRLRLALLDVSNPFTATLSRKPAAYEFRAERIGRLTGSYADALLAAHSSARSRTAHAHELTRIVRED